MNEVRLVKKELFQEFDIETRDGVKVGKAEIDINRNMITRLEILEPYRGKGYGTEVVKQLSEQWNCDSLWVERGNLAAIHAYQKNGYEFTQPVMFEMKREENK
jgi:predicted GNAT family acetyltransferase